MSKNKHNQSVGSTVERSDERIDQTGEVFTPAELCAEMVAEIPEDVLKNPNSTFLDNAVEMMEDNHQELCGRLGVSVDHPHYVCADALEYDYSFGQPVGLESFFA